MVVYVVGQARVNEADGFKKYSETVAGLAEKFGGKLIAAGSSELQLAKLANQIPPARARNPTMHARKPKKRWKRASGTSGTHEQP